MISFARAAIIAVVGVSMSSALESPRIKRIETVNFSNLMAPTDTVFIAPGKVKEFRLYGPWLDWTTKVTLLNIEQGILEKRPTFNSDGGLLRLNIAAVPTASPGVAIAVVNIGCPPFPSDCAPVITFPVRIVRVGTATTITPNTNVPAGERLDFTITGTNLSTATIFEFRTALKNPTNVVATANTLRFSALTTSCGTNRVHVRDRSVGGDYYPFPGGLDVRLDSACGVARIATGGLSSGGSSPGAPDLVPVMNSTLLRHLAPIRKVASEPFCQGLFAQPTTSVVRTITVSNISWGVRNAGGSNVVTPFRIRLLRDGAIVSEQVVSSLNAGATFTASYSRPRSQTEVARLAQVPNSVARATYNATGADCVQTVGQSSAMDWQDPAYEVRVDPLMQVTAETNRSNNNKSY